MLEKLRKSIRMRNVQEGATAVEYGLMVALIAVVIIVAVVFLGKEVSSTFKCTGDQIAAGSSATTC